ncbi:MAG: hypothetical protein U0636_04555 [Phycisphaerales bacterium]
MLGFAAEVPGGLVVTGSQRADVLERALAAARSPDGANSLGAAGVVKAMPWLLPQPDAVVFVGVGEPGGRSRPDHAVAARRGALPLQFEPAAMEPVACAMRSALTARGRPRAWCPAL